MVGRLNLRHVSDDDPLEMSSKPERALDSPDSGLPPSPSPSPWPVPVPASGTGGSASEDEARGQCVVPVKTKFAPLCPLSYGEGIELDPLPPKEIRYTSSVRYDSDRHFIHNVSMQPRGLGLDLCSQTVLALPGSTWRRYRTQLEFQPRQRVQRVQSTTIVYPKHARTVYTTQLNYNGQRLARRFLSSVELEASDYRPGKH
ncbi:refilin-B isoform X5 [Denticeps clupeoides]|uniref:Refilin B n=1 Tax=Denticeps clupeoides TaxID=299321 RepID=A0AAY4D5H1_9TELE|nr:refilin-B isoform X5 [Denticeps clupeoides]XP_028857559.1 refilin-B isoform X5 [Denticeps clupeoides]